MAQVLLYKIQHALASPLGRLHHHWGGASAFNKNMEEKTMKTRTLGLVAGMVLVAASAGFSQAAELKMANDTPDIIRSIENADSYKAMNKQEMGNTKGEFWPVVAIILTVGIIIASTKTAR
jgi:hypothetical protein